jgi:putative ABC transport system ATP-binding protein
MTTTISGTGTAHIQCDDLVRIFSAEGVEVQALQGLTLAVDRGELTAIVGASGSGKSTLLTILSGLDVPTAGSASVAGHDLLAMSTRERTHYRRNTVGFVWQQTSRNLLSYLTAAENLAMTLAVANRPRRERSARITELLDLLGIAELRDRLPAQMSGGQQQRVAIAIALANEPEVLFADEPTGELDEANSMLVFDAMRDVNERLGVTVLIVTHDQGVSSHVRRTVQIRDGRTSTEVLRSTRTDEHGVESHIAEEFAVLDRVGRLQLPQEYITRLSMRDRVRLELESTHVEVHPTSADNEVDSDPHPEADATADIPITTDEHVEDQP